MTAEAISKKCKAVTGLVGKLPLELDVEMRQMEFTAEIAAQLAELNTNLEWWGNRMLEHWSRSGG